MALSSAGLQPFCRSLIVTKLSSRCFGTVFLSNNRTSQNCSIATKIIQDKLSSTSGYKKLLMRSAGHSHWQNIRHIKGAKDAQRWKKTQAINQKIKLALKNGGSDPKLNRDLQRAIDEGRTNNIAMASMLDFIKKVTESKDTGVTMIAEAKGVGNSFLMIECFTDSQAHTRKTLRAQLRKRGCELLDSGRAASMFDHKGVIYVIPGADDTLDTATEQAIQVGAEEVLTGMTDGGQECLKFLCDIKELHQVKQSLEDLKVSVEDARLEYIPHTYITLNEVQLDSAREMLEAVGELDDVVRIYDNIQSLADADS